MAAPSEVALSRRERQIMDVVYQGGKVCVADVVNGLPDPPSYSAVRALMRILEEKGHLKHAKRGAKYIYSATRPRQVAARSAMRRVLKTFFDGSAEKAMVALLDVSPTRLTAQQLDRIAALMQRTGSAENQPPDPSEPQLSGR